MHLRYLQRDGTTRDGERGQLYGATRDQEDGRAFAERGESDRHSFRFIVAPEDGDRLSDLHGYTGAVQLASGKFAVVESPFALQLVPWRSVIDKQLGREVSGIARDGGGIEWQIGRSRGLGI